jgi:hypothetical protein
LPYSSTAVHDDALTQETAVKPPKGSICVKGDQVDPSKLVPSPEKSTATQNGPVAHEMEEKASSKGSTRTGSDQPEPSKVSAWPL